MQKSGTSSKGGATRLLFFNIPDVMKNIDEFLLSFIEAYNSGNYNTAVKEQRHIIEAILKEIYIEKTGNKVQKKNLNFLIEFLDDKKIIPGKYILHLRVLQNFGNFANHFSQENKYPIDKEDCQSIINHLKIFLEWYYSKSIRLIKDAEILLDISASIEKHIFLIIDSSLFNFLLVDDKVEKIKDKIEKLSDNKVIFVDSSISGEFNIDDHNFISIGQNEVTLSFLSKLHIKYENEDQFYRYRKSGEKHHLVLIGETLKETNEIIERFSVDSAGVQWYLERLEG